MSKQVKEYDQPGSLMKRTRELLLERDDMVEVIVGTRLPHLWLYNFRRGYFTNPSVNRVQVLYEYLSNTKLVP